MDLEEMTRVLTLFSDGPHTCHECGTTFPLWDAGINHQLDKHHFVVMKIVSENGHRLVAILGTWICVPQSAA